MRNFRFLLLAGLSMLASSCSLTGALRRETPAEKVAGILAAHPELLAKPETVQVKVPFAVPQISFEKELVPVFDTVYVRRDASRLDTLLGQLQTRLDSAERAAVQAKVHGLLLSRPVLYDTLRFDTLGVRGKVWRTGRSYRLHLVRAAIQDTARGRAPVPRLVALPPALLPFYNPAGWPWWLVFVLGMVAGAGLLRGLVEIVYRLQRRADA